MRSPMHSLGFVRRPEIALVAFGAFLSSTCGGCLSNRYVIPQPELMRLAQLPPEQRGQHVHVVQQLGERRADPIDGTQPMAPAGAFPQEGLAGPPPPPYAEPGIHPHVGVLIVPGPGPIGHGHGGHGFVGGAGPGFAGGGGAAPGIGAPLGRAPRVAPATPPASGAGGSKLGSGKRGGGGGKDDLAVFLIVLATVATIGMVATEGARYDGHIALYPWQHVHLEDASGQEREVPLAQLTPADAASAREATVMDDEGWGLMRLGRRPLDRKGFAFKLDLGGFSAWNGAPDNGFGLNVKLGYFPHHRFGLLAGWRFATASGPDATTYTRNDLSVEAQLFPFSVWRLHPGVFGHAGIAYARTGEVNLEGGAFGGGINLELALTTRLALVFRADHSLAQVANGEDGWASVSTFTAGVAIY